ncbi:MAG: NADH-quinone oxidoreductase subunit J [Chitinophagales bacterium]|jgi:NADH-quinone oxidoreductase subunit J|nr:NADH-quinone oxidoreductase subunit J [Sphingobacteriales bacterium]
MDLTNIAFIAFSAITLICALMVVLARNPIYSVIFLILTMFSLTGHYVLLQAQFIAVINIIVYAGAIMVLFLFVLMLMNMNASNEPNKSLLWKVLAGFISGGTLITLLVIYLKNMGDIPIQPTNNSALGAALPPDFGYVKPLGKMLFTDYVFPFEIASILFIAAMVGAVFLGSREKRTDN